MPAFSYQALDGQGQSQRGVQEADSARALRSALRERGLIPMAVEQIEHTEGASSSTASKRHWTQIEIWKRPVLNAEDLCIWTRQLAGLVSSGLSLERALGALADEAEKPEQQKLLGSLRSEVNAGAGFAKALSQHPREFAEVYVAVIAAGEQSGHLDQVLERLADDLEQGQALKNKLVGAALYPAIVSLVAVAIVIFLMTYVLPQVSQVFVNSKRSLPLLTVIMLGLSSLVRQWGWLVLMLLVSLGFTLRWLRTQTAARLKMDERWLKLPLLGRLSAGYNAARFAATMSLLSNAGVPMLKALQAAAATLNNRAMRADALDVLTLVREGSPLGVALADKKRFPGLLAMFARLGEQTGQLPLMLQRAAKQLGDDVSRRAMQFATLLEPLLIVGMGLLVMMIVLAVLLPIIELNQWGGR
jgi:general secretion pathway protein F